MPNNNNKPSTFKRLNNISKEAFALLLWLYIVIRIMFFDVDVYILGTYFPSYFSIIYYKLFIFLGIISVLWLLLGNKEFPKFVLFVATYPFRVIFWRLPKVIFKNWSVAIILSPAIFEVASSFRLFFISYSLASIATICIFVSTNKLILFSSMIILMIMLAIHLVLSFNQAYKATFFSKFAEILNNIKLKLSDSDALHDVLDKAAASNTNKDAIDSRFATLYIFHSAAAFLTDKIRDVMRSRKMDIYLILAWLWTVILTSIVFSLEYFSLYKISPNAFSVPYPPGYFSFLGFSFGKLTPASVSVITPSSSLATILCYAELGCSVVIVIIFAFTILTAARERYKEDSEDIISNLVGIADICQDCSQKLFNMAMVDVENILLHHNQSLVNGLRKLRGMPLMPLITPEKKEENKS